MYYECQGQTILRLVKGQGRLLSYRITNNKTSFEHDDMIDHLYLYGSRSHSSYTHKDHTKFKVTMSKILFSSKNIMKCKQQLRSVQQYKVQSGCCKNLLVQLIYQKR